MPYSINFSIVSMNSLFGVEWYRIESFLNIISMMPILDLLFSTSIFVVLSVILSLFFYIIFSLLLVCLIQFNFNKFCILIHVFRYPNIFFVKEAS